MSTSAHAQKVKQTWDVKKMQEAAVKMSAHRIVGRLHFMEKHPGKEVDEMENVSAICKAEMMKKCGVKTPMDLVKHIADFEVNMFGTEASIEGEEKHAIMVTEKSTVWLEAIKLGKMTKEQEALMQTHYRQWIDSLAKAFDFKAKLEITKDGHSSKITFSQK